MTLSSAECIDQVTRLGTNAKWTCGAGVSPAAAAGTAAPQEQGVFLKQALGVSRVVLPRELSLKEIAQIHRQTAVELEVFVHGAFCISYSGQCLASLALGGRSGNRGQCAQACRLQYELMASDNRGIADSRPFVDEKKYLFSPSDLAAFDLLPELIAAGVAALKIEGRLKGAEYVAVVTRFYRRAVDEAAAGRRADFAPRNLPSWRQPSPAAFPAVGSTDRIIKRSLPAIVRPNAARSWAKFAAFAATGCGLRWRPLSAAAWASFSKATAMPARSKADGFSRFLPTAKAWGRFATCRRNSMTG